MNVEHGEPAEGAVWAGVDTHADSHWLCVLGARGQVLESARFAADAAGYDELAAAIARCGEPAAVGVEGTATYGAGLARRLAELGMPVWEVLAPGRAGRRPGARKSDPADAERAARRAMSGEGLSVPKSRDGWVEALGPLLAARERLVRCSVEAANTALGILRAAPEELRSRFAGLGSSAAAARALSEDALAWELGPVAAAALAAARALAESWARSREAARALLREMEALLRANLPGLLAVRGCGPVSAAKLACAAGDNPGRLRSEGAFAALCGACPVEASSGRTARHRLNRGGDRRANSALHEIARHRLMRDPATGAYAEGRRAEGLSDREIMRCLKRYVAREVYRVIRAGSPGRAGRGGGLDSK